MISLKDIYHVVEAIVPLYVAMLLAYLSVKWWKLFTPDQCSGINKYVAKFTVPFLTFQVISTNNLYKMDLKFIYADLLQKLITFVALAAISKFNSRCSFKWIITGLSLSTLPNTLIIGIPLLKAMYGEEAALLLAQIVVLQGIIWYNLLLVLFELINALKAAPIAAIPEATEVELEARPESPATDEGEEAHKVTARKVKSLYILLKAGRKLMINPNTHATLLGLIWSSIHFRWEIKMPEIIDQSILIMTAGGLGMSMFSLGLFTALQPRLIACGTRMAAVAMALKFIIGPAIMAASALAIGLRGTLFKIAFLQAALPQGIVPFVFAKEYNVHPEVVSTGVLFGMIITMPVILAYYFLLALL